MTSLKSRLSAGLFISLVVVFALLWLLVSTSIRYLAEDYISSRLDHDAQTLLGATQIDDDGVISIDNNKLDAIYTRPFSGHYFTIQAGENIIRSRSLWDQSLEVKTSAPGFQNRGYGDGPQEQPLIITTNGYLKNGKQITIAMAEDMTTIEKDISEFQRNFALMALGLLALLIIIQNIILHMGLLPLARIRHDVSLLESGDKDHLSENVPDEVAPLIREVNHLLQVLVTRLQRSRNSLGDLAHAMKKPLTVLTQLQHDETLQQSDELKQTIEDQVNTMRRTTDHVLKRARLAGQGPVSAYFDLDKEIPFLLETLQRIHRQKTIDVNLNITNGKDIRADREDMLELLGNLLDNAYKWTAHHINLSVLLHDSNAEIIIEDDGPGIPKDALKSLLQRGARLDEQVEGHGLGLAIVQDIVQMYNGSIQMDESDTLHGLRVTVTLPA